MVPVPVPVPMVAKNHVSMLIFYPVFKNSHIMLLQLSLRPSYAKTCLWAYAASEDPDQPTHQRRLIMAFVARKQNKRTRRLIWAFAYDQRHILAGRGRNFVAFRQWDWLHK